MEAIREPQTQLQASHGCSLYMGMFNVLEMYMGMRVIRSSRYVESTQWSCVSSTSCRLRKPCYCSILCKSTTRSGGTSQEWKIGADELKSTEPYTGLSTSKDYGLQCTTITSTSLRSMTGAKNRGESWISPTCKEQLIDKCKDYMPICGLSMRYVPSSIARLFFSLIYIC